jgi:hypothetical protein
MMLALSANERDKTGDRYMTLALQIAEATLEIPIPLFLHLHASEVKKSDFKMIPLSGDYVERLKDRIADMITEMEKDSVRKSLVDVEQKKEKAYANYFRYLNGGRRCLYLYILAPKSTGEWDEAFGISNDAREVW